MLRRVRMTPTRNRKKYQVSQPRIQTGFLKFQMAVKSKHLKKLMITLIVLCIGTLALLYSGRLEDLQRTKPRSTKWKIWTWECEEEQCVRRVRESGEKHIPLATCRMQCGDLPLWPLPQQIYNVRTQSIGFKQIRVEIMAEAKPVQEMLQEAAHVFKQNILSMVPLEADMSSRWLGELVVVLRVLKSDQLLTLKTNESYTLNLTTLRAEVQAKTYFGARHALETLTQLVWWNDVSLRVIQRAFIKDQPSFPYRGVLVDTARNFIPLPVLQRTVDALAACKLNVLHWHISDSQSFPFDSPRVPEMARYGAYSPDKIYSASDVAELVKYALIRGVRVLIEIDAPAHVGNGWQWGENHGLGNLSVCVNKQPWSAYCGEPPCGQLNPDNSHTYEVLGKLYEDIVELTNVTDVFHMGGDEVDFNCWSYALHDNSDMMEKWKHFQKKALEKLTSANRGKVPEAVILWSSKFTTPYNLDKKVHVVQVWGGSDWSATSSLIETNIRLIISHVDYWYLDCGFGNWRGQGPGACQPVSSWQHVYEHRPWLNLKRSLILGGEVCLWGEMVDENSLEMKLWPRTAAFAERMWSDPNTEETLRGAHGRLAMHRERLVGRGIKSDAMWPEWCTHNPHLCLEPLET
ncbi:putative beta-hexosaminidase fdl [Blattella germanica]|nr:putative beta-hexosaminidase fdl [Blattella germanica]